MRSKASSLPSEEGGPGKKGQSPPAAVRPNPSLSEAREVEHTLPHGEELAGTTQALLPLCSELTPRHGDQLATPSGENDRGMKRRARHPPTEAFHMAGTVDLPLKDSYCLREEIPVAGLLVTSYPSRQRSSRQTAGYGRLSATDTP